eukprot:gene8067-1309_t
MNSLGSLSNLNFGNGFERSFSFDDLLGGIARLSGQAGLVRSESEAVFQEFLKKIPSATNLAALGAAAHQANADHINDSSAAEGAANLVSMGLPNGTGVPRVPSLDFLRALVVNQQHQHSGAYVKQEQQQQHQLSLPIASLGTMPSPDYNFSALQGIPGLTSPAAYAAQLHGGNLATNAAMKLHNLSHGMQSIGTASSAPASSDGCKSNGEVDDKAEARRARRMLSNRESARRSRRRKQEMLNKLELELNVVADSKKEVADQVEDLSRKCSAAEEEHRRLKEENARLKDELGFLRSEISERKLLQREPLEEPHSKRCKSHDV